MAWALGAVPGAGAEQWARDRHLSSAPRLQDPSVRSWASAHTMLFPLPGLLFPLGLFSQENVSSFFVVGFRDSLSPESPAGSGALLGWGWGEEVGSVFIVFFVFPAATTGPGTQ